ncbi:MAG: hypothetical protein ACKESB_03395 [Candidatus Hodgkinia cicadicola]
MSENVVGLRASRPRLGKRKKYNIMRGHGSDGEGTFSLRDSAGGRGGSEGCMMNCCLKARLGKARKIVVSKKSTIMADGRW